MRLLTATAISLSVFSWSPHLAVYAKWPNAITAVTRNMRRQGFESKPIAIFSDLNNLQIADLMSQFLEKKRLD